MVGFHHKQTQLLESQGVLEYLDVGQVVVLEHHVPEVVADLDLLPLD